LSVRISIVWGAALCSLAVFEPLEAQDGVGFHFALGWQDTMGELGDVFDPGIDAEFSVTGPLGPLRVGGGANMASFDVSGQEASFSQVQLHMLVSYAHPVTETILSYAQARATHRRLRPEDQRYFDGPDEVLRDVVFSGYGFEGVLGAWLMLSARSALDLSAAIAPFGVSPDLSSEGLGTADSGASVRFHVGVSWFPVNPR